MIEAFLKGYGVLLGYFVVCASAALILRKMVKVPKEVFRKLLHFILLGSVFVFTYGFAAWWQGALASVLFILLVYPLLTLAERIPGYSRLLVERNPGEIKRSLVVVFTMFALVIALCWGWQQKQYLVIASVLAWGVGDAAAALVGKKIGKRAITGRLVEGTKSLEGSLAMFAFSSLSVFGVLASNSPVPWWGMVVISLVTGLVSAVVELFTKNGMDTFTCPIAAMAVMIPLLRLWGG